MAKTRNLGGSGFKQTAGPVNLDTTPAELKQFFDEAEQRLKNFQASIASGAFGVFTKMGLDLQKQFDAANKRAEKMVRTIKEGKIGAMLGEASDRLGKFRSQLEKISPAARTAFITGTAAITGFVAAASPDTMQTFTKSMQLLAASIGQAFVPYIIKAAAWVQRLAAWFRQLTPEQKEQYAQWALIGVGIAGVIMLLPKVVAAAQLASVAMKGLYATSMLTVGSLAAVAAALTYVAGATLSAANKWDQVSQTNQRQRNQGFTEDELNDPTAKRLMAIKDHAVRAKEAWAEFAQAQAVIEKMQPKSGIGSAAMSMLDFPLLNSLVGNQAGALIKEDPRRAILSSLANRRNIAQRIAESAGKGESLKPTVSGKSSAEDLLLSLHHQQASFVGLAEAHKQAQIEALNGGPLDQQILEIQRQSKEQLVNIAGNTAAMAAKPEPKPAVGR